MQVDDGCRHEARFTCILVVNHIGNKFTLLDPNLCFFLYLITRIHFNAFSKTKRPKIEGPKCEVGPQPELELPASTPQAAPNHAHFATKTHENGKKQNAFPKGIVPKIV